MKKGSHKRQHLSQSQLKKRLVIYLSSFIGIATLVLLSIVAFFIFTAPSVSQEDLIGTIPSTIYDKNGTVISKIGSNDRVLIDPSDIPAVLEEALISIEDRRFYDHNGVDIIRIGGALFANLSNRAISQGGSTITQQLIKLSVFSTREEDQTIKRKIQEAWLALQIERDYTKKDILALYMNKVYLSNNIYGFGTAARYYFNKSAHDLTVAQAALLAGMIQAPTTYDPYLHPEAAIERRNLVIGAMLANNSISQADHDAAINTPLTDGLINHAANKSATELAIDAYVQVVLDEIKQKTSLDPYKDGLDIYTHLDMSVQNRLMDVLNTPNYINWINNDVQAAVTITNPQDGSIIAMAGGRNVSVQLGLNRATTASRSVGSTSKPLIDYGPAIEYLNYSTAEPLSDSPITYSDGTPLYNWDQSYFGNVTMRTALAASRNTPALRTLRAVGLDNAYAFLAKLNINVNNNGYNGLVESNSIGFVASPLQMGSAYGAFANGGTYFKPFTIRKIVTRTGEEASYVGEGTRVMKDSTAYMITDILKGVPGVYAESAGINSLYHAGKTGTTNYADSDIARVTGNQRVDFAAPDAWFVGYTKDFVISTWVGYDNPMHEGNYLNRLESTYPQMIYRNMMLYLSQQKQNTDWQMPRSIERFGSELYLAGTRPKYVETQTYRETNATTTDEESESRSSESRKSSQDVDVEPASSALLKDLPIVSTSQENE